MISLSKARRPGRLLLLAALALTTVVYWPGLSGGWLFDDFPNIVENPGVQPDHADVASLVRAALSSPASEFKRPLSSLTFAVNYLISGLHPYTWKLTNLALHLFNGALLFVLARMLLRMAYANDSRDRQLRAGIVAALIAGAWMLLPINLTGVLYVVQRMESMANIFVLLGLIGYVSGRVRMFVTPNGAQIEDRRGLSQYTGGLLACAASLVVCTAIGILAKETAIMLPLYAFLIEWIMFGFRRNEGAHGVDRGLAAIFLLVLVLPMLIGLAWLLPHIFHAGAWATRDFTLRTRLLSEARIVVGYIAWTFVPLPHWLSFYHDDFHVSTSLLHPWTTLASTLVLLALVAAVIAYRRKHPLVALGIALFLGCQLLTATVLPLELIYEHRNYFASFGLLLAVVPLLAVPRGAGYARLRHGLLLAMLLVWTVATALTAYAWGDPLRLARDLAARAPDSPRAQYELGRSYILYSHYDPVSPYTPLVYPALERAARLPDSSILPQQALIFFNARMRRPIRPKWWDSLIASLRQRKPGVQDESSLAALVACAREGACELSQARMQEAFRAALSHPDTDARLYAYYSDYAWNVVGDHDLGLAMIRRAVESEPGEPAYHITLARMLLARGEVEQARAQILALQRLNYGGRLDGSIRSLQNRLATADTLP